MMIKKNIIYQIKHYINIFLAAMIPDTYKKIDKCDVLLCCHDVDRADTINGKAYSKLIDSVFDDLSHKGWICRQFAYPPAFFAGHKAWGKPVSANRAYLLIALSHLLFKILSILPGMSNNLNINNQYGKMNLLYGKLLDVAMPKCIIAIGSPPALCRVAKTKAIPVYELLHGIGYSTVPWGWEHEESNNLPDEVLSLDAISTRTFLTLRSKEIKVKQIPHPFFRRFNNKDEYKRLPLEWKGRPSWIPSNRKIILYSISWGYDGDHGNHLQFKDILKNGIIHEKLINVIEETQSQIYWLLRLHPVQLRLKKYNHQKRFLKHLVQRYANCEWERSSLLPLPLLLKFTDGHIAMCSMTAYDAAFMSVKSLMLCPTLRAGNINGSLFADLRESGFVELGDFCAKSIKDWVCGVERADKPFACDSNATDWDEVVQLLLGSVNKG